MRIELIDHHWADTYRAFIRGCSQANIYAAWDYRQLLSTTLNASPKYLALIDSKDNMLAVLPAFLYRHQKYGNILNSLPFFGSYGGVLTHTPDPESMHLLLDGFEDLAQQHSCVSSTIVVSPFDLMPDLYEGRPHDCRDTRIGQVTPLPKMGDDLEGRLFTLYEGARRTDIRKARKEQVQIEITQSLEALKFIESTHNDNMIAIGGTGKPSAFYRSIEHTLLSTDSCRMFLARKNGIPVAGLLNLYHNKIADYFTPATVASCRHLQAMSLCIHSAMIDAVKHGFTLWNWGGTWHTQDGVYNFKSKWGTQDIPYHYYTRLYEGSERLRSLSTMDLAEAYPYFFVMPYNELTKNNSIPE